MKLPVPFQEVDLAGLNSPPRESAQSIDADFPVSFGRHPPGATTQTACPDVEGKTRTPCSGLPTRSSKEDQSPSAPSLEVCEESIGIVEDRIVAD